MSIASESSVGVVRESVGNLASTFRRMRDERWESGCGCCFWGRGDTHLAGLVGNRIAETNAHEEHGTAVTPPRSDG